VTLRDEEDEDEAATTTLDDDDERRQRRRRASGLAAEGCNCGADVDAAAPLRAAAERNEPSIRS